jgi:pimeloyl-ACP methyl ester carboxylesterase
MRCEKEGSGDATGTPCSDIGFREELDGFRAALAKLRRYDFVDSTRVFVFGHSMGGIEAPMLAAETPVRGVLVFGTGVLPWAEYLVENERRQTRLAPDVDLVALEARCRDLSDFLHEVFRKRRPIEEVVAERPDLKTLADEYWPDGAHCFGRHLEFYRGLDAVNHAEAWAKVDAPVLAMWGDLDYTTCLADHEYIAQIVGSEHPGAATVAVLPNVFHAFNRRDSVQQTLEAPWQGPLAPEVVQTVVSWLQGQAAPRAAG